MEALQDVSAAIHLDPNGAQAFYHRACLLQTSQPKQALRDLSVSLLLDDSAANVSAYLHRGILYTLMKWLVSTCINFLVGMGSHANTCTHTHTHTHTHTLCEATMKLFVTLRQQSSFSAPSPPPTSVQGSYTCYTRRTSLEPSAASQQPSVLTPPALEPTSAGRRHTKEMKWYVTKNTYRN